MISLKVTSLIFKFKLFPSEIQWRKGDKYFESRLKKRQAGAHFTKKKKKLKMFLIFKRDLKFFNQSDNKLTVSFFGVENGLMSQHIE